MIIKELVYGKLVGEEDGPVLRLDAEEAGHHVYLAYALVTQGPGHHVLPSVLLDDWGNEIEQLRLYDWIKENGMRFPRAEVFGKTPSGQSVQYFLRDLELFGKYPVYVFAADDAPDSSGTLLPTIVIVEEDADSPEPGGPPDWVSGRLRSAQVEWRRAGPE